ncbi:MAG: hypothetical protein ACJ741_16365 [Pyrinomonadaceae bacterium]
MAEFTSASWAIWSNEFNQLNCLEAQPQNILPFILRNTDRLNPAVVFLGLNRSRSGASYSFQNFHAMRHTGDFTLKRYIQEGNPVNLRGGFMTDINARDVSPTGSDVAVSVEDVEHFKEQFQVLDQSSFKVICFGNQAFSALVNGLGCERKELLCLDASVLMLRSRLLGRTLDIFRVWHYSNRGYNSKNVAELKQQLAYLNERIS